MRLVFKCFFFFFERRDWEIPPLKKFLSISNIFPVFLVPIVRTQRSQDYEALDILEPSDKWLFLPSHWFFLWNVSGKTVRSTIVLLHFQPDFDLSMQGLSRGVDIDASTRYMALFCDVLLYIFFSFIFFFF